MKVNSVIDVHVSFYYIHSPYKPSSQHSLPHQSLRIQLSAPGVMKVNFLLSTFDQRCVVQYGELGS